MLQDYFANGWPHDPIITRRFKEFQAWKQENGSSVCLGGTEQEYQILNAIAKLYPHGEILEIGPGDGCSSEAMLLGTTCNILQVNLDNRGLRMVSDSARVIQHTERSDYFVLRNTQLFDIVFVDGEHATPYVEGDIEAAVACTKHDGVVLLHDVDQHDINVAGKHFAAKAGRSYIQIETDGHGIGIIYK